MQCQKPKFRITTVGLHKLSPCDSYGSLETLATSSNHIVRARGRREEAVTHASFKLSETYAPAALPTIKPSVSPPSPSLSDSVPLPQTRTNEGPMSSLRQEPQPSLSDKKNQFIDRFSKDDWNYPGVPYPEMSTALNHVKALVVCDWLSLTPPQPVDFRPFQVAIYYPLPNHLPAAYADAFGIIDMLGMIISFNIYCAADSGCDS